MTSVVEPESSSIRYEGGSVQDDLVGGIQANFVVCQPGQHEYEVGVIFTEAVAADLARDLGREDTPAFHQTAARDAGQCYLERLLKSGRRISPVMMLSRAALEAEPDFIDELKRRFGD